MDPAGTGSFYNEGEADIAIKHVLSLVYAGVSPKAIVIQSPYVAQVQLLREKLQEVPEAKGVEVATIDSFQGREADAVIISMVNFAFLICGLAVRIFQSKAGNLTEHSSTHQQILS